MVRVCSVTCSEWYKFTLVRVKFFWYELLWYELTCFHSWWSSKSSGKESAPEKN